MTCYGLCVDVNPKSHVFISGAFGRWWIMAMEYWISLLVGLQLGVMLGGKSW